MNEVAYFYIGFILGSLTMMVFYGFLWTVLDRKIWKIKKRLKSEGKDE